MHDGPVRMLAKGVLRGIVPWAAARAFLAGRLRRRLAEEALVKHIAGEGLARVAADEVACLAWRGAWLPATEAASSPMAAASPPNDLGGGRCWEAQSKVWGTVADRFWRRPVRLPQRPTPA
jgi:acetyl-CoA carboxylase/biotin carboxylase 1